MCSNMYYWLISLNADVVALSITYKHRVTEVQTTKDKAGKTQRKPFVQWRWKTSWNSTTGRHVPLTQVYTLDMIRRLQTGDPKKGSVARNPARVHVQDTRKRAENVCECVVRQEPPLFHRHIHQPGGGKGVA